MWSLRPGLPRPEAFNEYGPTAAPNRRAVASLLIRDMKMNPRPDHILKDGPFLRTGEPTASNAGLLGLLLPILISAPFMRDSDTGLAWGWPLALVGGFLGVLIFAPDRRASLTRLDWAAGSVLAGLMLVFPENRSIGLAAVFGAGFICGGLSARPSAARLLGSPGLTPIISLGATLLIVGVASRLMPFQEKPLHFQWGLVYWPHLFALAAAGLCFATGRVSILYWGIPWVAAVVSFLLIPLSSDFYLFGRLNIFMVPAFFIAPQLARSKLELAVYEALTLLFLFFPAPRTVLVYQGLDPAVFWLVVSFWPVRRWFRKKNPAAVEAILPKTSAAKAFIKCGHHGSGPHLAEWTGLPSCRLAAAHDGGPLACPYGCPGFGDCARACPFQAIRLNEDSFPLVDLAACRGCGRCAEACPKGLIELVEGEARALIPCRSQSGLKKNAAYCERSCLGCGRCRKACPAGAISREATSGAMKVDQSICRAYGAACERVCARVCPRKII